MSNRAAITTWNGPGACLEGLRRAEGSQGKAEWIANERKPDSLSKEMTKQQQTTATTSNPSESPNTGAPPPHGDALVAYANAKREKNCPGKENGSKKK